MSNERNPYSPLITDLRNAVIRRATRIYTTSQDEGRPEPVEVFFSSETAEKTEAARIAVAAQTKALIVKNLTEERFEPHKPRRRIAGIEGPPSPDLYQLTRTYTFKEGYPLPSLLTPHMPLRSPAKNLSALPESRHRIAIFGFVAPTSHGKHRLDPETIDIWLTDAHIVIMDPKHPQERFASVVFTPNELPVLVGPSNNRNRFDELNVTLRLLNEIATLSLPQAQEPSAPSA